MEKVELERINQLARKKKNEGLSKEETVEQQELFAKYLTYVKERVSAQLKEAGHFSKKPS